MFFYFRLVSGEVVTIFLIGLPERRTMKSWPKIVPNQGSAVNDITIGGLSIGPQKHLNNRGQLNYMVP